MAASCPASSEADLTPLVLLLSLLTAAALGAGHALTPGHGKTLMAAYLVGTRGHAAPCLGLGLSVSVSHTVGHPRPGGDRRGRRGRAAARRRRALGAGRGGAVDRRDRRLDAGRRAPAPATVAVPAGATATRPRGPRTRPRATTRHDAARATTRAADDAARAADHDHGLEHRHGGVTHSHAPAPGSTITWRSLFVLGLAGGLIPSTSALLILLGSIAAGRPGFGFVLVVAFGLGMAAVMGGIGLVIGRGAQPARSACRAAAASVASASVVPLVAAVLVFGFGIYLTAQALGAAPTL